MILTARRSEIECCWAGGVQWRRRGARVGRLPCRSFASFLSGLLSLLASVFLLVSFLFNNVIVFRYSSMLSQSCTGTSSWWFVNRCFRICFTLLSQMGHLHLPWSVNSVLKLLPCSFKSGHWRVPDEGRGEDSSERDAWKDILDHKVTSQEFIDLSCSQESKYLR